ncbi:MAG: PAS domain S-box protein [Candidatus Margulisiibacteriota bacterium]|jgi:PAS domain S-box-containing protein
MTGNQDPVVGIQDKISLDKVFAQIPGMVYQFLRKPDGTYTVPFASEAIRGIFGCSPQDVRHDFSLIIKALYLEDKERVIQSIEDSADKLTPWQCEYRVQLPGQPIRWMLARSVPERQNDGSIIWFGYNVDITERKMAEEAVRQSEEKFSAAFKASPDLMSITRLSDGQILDVNNGYSRLLGYARDETVGKTTAELSIWADAAERAKFIALLKESGEVNDLEITLRRKDGTLVPCLDSARTFNLQGEPCVLSVVKDITGQKRADNDFSKKVSELERFNKVAMEREDRIIELKQEVKKLKEQLMK